MRNTVPEASTVTARNDDDTPARTVKFMVSREAGFLALYYLAWGLMFYPAITMPGEGFLGGIRSDPAAYIYYVIHNIQHVLTWPSTGFDANYFYPFGKSLAYSDNFILPALMAKPVYLLTGRYTIAYNFALITAPVLNGYFTFCLARKITGTVLVAFIAGFSFMSLPFLYGHLGHPQLQFAFFIPAILLATFHFVEQRTPLSATLLGGCVVLQFLATAYYALIVYVLSGLVLVCYGVLRFRTLRLRDFAVLFLANIPWALALVLVSEPYKAVRDVFGPMPRALVKHFCASFSSYIAMSPHHLLWGHFAGPFASNGSWLSVGFVTMFLAAAAAALLLASRRFCGEAMDAGSKISRLLKWTFVCALIFLIVAHVFWGNALSSNHTTRTIVLSTGMWTLLGCAFGYILMRGFRDEGKVRALTKSEYGYIFLFLTIFYLFASFGIIGYHGGNTPNPELYAWLYNYLPGYNSMRAVYRFGIVTGLGLILLSALALSHLIRMPRFQGSLARCSVLLPVFLLIVVEMKTQNYKPSKRGKRPAVYKQLDAIPGTEAAISLPFFSPLKNGLQYSRTHTGYMLWMLPTGRPMMSGWSSKLPRYYQFMGPRLDTFPSQESLTSLGQIVGLKYLIYHGQQFDHFDQESFSRQREQVGDQITLLYQNPNRPDFLFQLSPVLEISSLEYPELYMKPDTDHARSLSFEARIVSVETSRSPQTIRVHTGFVHRNGKKEAQQREVLVPSTNEWTPIQLEIPPSTHLVIPHKIRFLDLDQLSDQRVQIRNLLETTEEQ